MGTEVQAVRVAASANTRVVRMASTPFAMQIQQVHDRISAQTAFSQCPLGTSAAALLISFVAHRRMAFEESLFPLLVCPFNSARLILREICRKSLHEFAYAMVSGCGFMKVVV